MQFFPLKVVILRVYASWDGNIALISQYYIRKTYSKALSQSYIPKLSLVDGRYTSNFFGTTMQ